MTVLKISKLQGLYGKPYKIEIALVVFTFFPQCHVYLAFVIFITKLTEVQQT